MDKCDINVVRKHLCNSCPKNVGFYISYLAVPYGTTKYKVLIC